MIKTLAQPQVFLAVSILLSCSGCISPNYKITGQADMLRVDPVGLSYLAEDEQPERIKLTKGDVYSIRLDSVYLRESKEIGGSEFLVYAEVFEQQPDDRQRLTRVVFNEVNQSAGLILNFRNRILIGPMQYTGRAIRVRLFVVELDRQENEIVSAMIREAMKIAGSFAPGVAAFAPTVSSVGDLLLLLNQDDRELSADFTLFPATESHGPFLETGRYAIIKTENRLRYKGLIPTESGISSRSNYEADEVFDAYGKPVQSTPEDYRGLFNYSDASDRGHPFYSDKNPITIWTSLRAAGDRMWLKPTVIEHREKGILYQENEKGESDPAMIREANMLAPGATLGDNEHKFVKYAANGRSQYDLLFGKEFAGGRASVPLGTRIEYREKSYALLTVVRGGDPVERGLFEELSEADARLVSDALQPPVTSALAEARLRGVSDAVIKLAESRRVAAEANRSVGRDAATRRSGKFPMAFVNRLVNSGSTDDMRTNQVVLDILRSMTVGLPFTFDDLADADKLSKLRKLTEANFRPNTFGRSEGDGTFTFVP